MKLINNRFALVAIQTYLISLLSLSSFAAAAGTQNAATCSLNDVSAAINAASSGDTIVIPKGTCAWTSKLTITKGITLQGQGKGNTIIKNSLPPGSYTYENYLIDYAPASPSLNEPFRITGLEFDGNRNGGGVRIKVYGPTLITKVRVDHNYFHDSTYVQSYANRCVMWGGFAYGVADNNEFKDCYKTFDVEGGDADAWNLLPVGIGTANSVFFEDNTINNTGAVDTSMVTSGGQGGRYVWRHNTILAMYDCQTFDAHGNFVQPGNRGTISTEIYDNTIVMGMGSNCGYNQFADIRGGTNMIFNNKVTSKFDWNGGKGNNTFQLREEHAGANATCTDNSGQLTYPCQDQIKNTYIWGNTTKTPSGTPENYYPNQIQGASEGILLLNRDYWLPTSGLEANRPTTCANNTYYGTTDTDKLYKCNNNTWTLQYTPYTYPHPLTTATIATTANGSITLSAPMNLRVLP